jgi:hypothetical protein
MDDPVEALADLLQDLQSKFPIIVVQEYIVPPVATRSNVAKGSGKLYA